MIQTVLGVFLILLHIVCCVLVWLGIKTHLLKVKKYLMALVIFVPFWGTVCVLLLHLQMLMEKLYAASPYDPEILEQYCDFMEEYLNQGILEAQMEREQRERYIRLLRQKLKVKTTLSTCMRLFQNLMKTGDYVQAEEILGLMDQKWHRKEEFWILKIRYLAERKKGAELQQCLRQMKEEQIYLSSKSKEELAFWLD